MKYDSGVSELIGVLLLLGIAVSSISVIYYIVLSDKGPTPELIANIVGTVEGKDIILEHHGGEPIDLDAEIVYVINGTTHYTTVGDCLSEEAKSDGKWNIGERAYIPFNYDINYIEQYNQTQVKIIDSSTNTLAFIGNLELKPMSDLGVEVYYEPEEAHLGDYVTIVVILKCNQGDVGSKDINIKCLLPDGLRHNWNTTTKGTYSNATGIWHVDKIDVGETATLTINATVIPMGERPFTQLAMVLDGSGSISDSDWNLMCTGLANAIKNESVFPHDGSVELTVVQFGGVSPPHAKVEEGPIIVTESNYNTIANRISSMKQMVDSHHNGATPMGCGIRLGTDKIHDSSHFNADNKSVMCMVTDGVPNCIWQPGGYSGTWMNGNGWRKNSSYYISSPNSACAYVHGYWQWWSFIPESSQDGPFITKDLDTSDATTIHINFSYRLKNTMNGELKVYYFDGQNYHLAANLGGGKEETWRYYDDIITDSSYFKPNFRVKLEANLHSYSPPYPETIKEIWIDNVVIETQNGPILNDGFDSDYWNAHWTDPGRISAEDAREYMLSTLNMSSNQDEFDCLAVGSDPDIYWLNWSMVWPQPGYIVPPYDQGGGWVNHINSYSEFETAIKEIFKTIFQARSTTIKIDALEPFDPNDNNDEIKLVIIPKE